MFYINPPKAKVALHTLENCVLARLEYLTLLENDKTDSFSGNIEYLLEYSLLDSVGHFILRLITSTSKDLWSFWIRNEELLLKHRLDTLSVRQVHRLLRTIIRHLKKRDRDETLISKSLTTLCQYFLEPQTFNHTFKKTHAKDCRKYHCRVPFAAIPELIGKRRIDLRNGWATVVCSEWKTTLLCLYRNFILEEKRLVPLPEGVVSSDPRLFNLSNVIYRSIERKLPEKGKITAMNIDKEWKKFPPCMQNLHAVLREKHRLGHHARFQYSLFLKECGMRIDDAVEYWRQEYSRPHACTSGCTHSWQKDEKKFLYSIRHLYGLEGGRKNYKMPNCKTICTDLPGLKYEGGCPFRHFDADRLATLLRSSTNESHFQKWFENTAIRRPEVACADFLKIVHNLEATDVSVQCPVEYYSIVKSNET